MKKSLLATLVAGLFATSANAGIVIPAGEWTLDINGNVNAYYTSTRENGKVVTPNGSEASVAGHTQSNITTGLLPNWIAISGKSRQNDLDIGFTISLQPGAATETSGTTGSINQRQAYMTIGDKSWGSVKLGKDLGIFASDAILNDMTLLGVGGGAAAVGNTTLGRIGAGYMYADWKSQIAYTTPNWDGLSFTVGVTQGWNAVSTTTGLSDESTRRSGAQPAFEAKVNYDVAVAGATVKTWASAFTQKVEGLSSGGSARASAWDVGSTVNVADFGLTGYYSEGKGTGTTFLLNDGLNADGSRRQSKDWYVQGTYKLPTNTKVGLSYGESNLDGRLSGAASDYANEMWVVGAYHPLTKSVNLVAEYSDRKTKLDVAGLANAEATAKTVSLGAILFF